MASNSQRNRFGNELHIAEKDNAWCVRLKTNPHFNCAEIRRREFRIVLEDVCPGRWIKVFRTSSDTKQDSTDLQKYFAKQHHRRKRMEHIR